MIWILVTPKFILCDALQFLQQSSIMKQPAVNAIVTPPAHNSNSNSNNNDNDNKNKKNECLDSDDEYVSESHHPTTSSSSLSLSLSSSEFEDIIPKRFADSSDDDSDYDTDSSDSDIRESTRGCDENKNKNKPCTTGPSRMNIHDFIEAVKIDDVFLQIFAHQWNRALYDVVIAAEEEYRFNKNYNQIIMKMMKMIVCFHYDWKTFY